MKTLYITDLDGTLLNNDGKVSEKSRKIINELTKDGVMFSVATSRSIMSARGLLDGIKFSAPIVLMSGVFVYDLAHEKAVKYFSLDADPFKKITEIFEKYEKSPFVFFYNAEENDFSIEFTALRLDIHKEFYQERKKLLGNKIHSVEKICPGLNREPVFVSICDEYSSLLPITRELDKTDGVGYSFYKDTYTKYWFLEVFNGEASKAKGLEIVKEFTGAQIAIAFGDNLNDIPLFTAADEGYAVQNAADELKAIALEIIDGNENDGVAKFIYEREKSI